MRPVIGRETELARLAAFVDGTGAGAFVVAGPAGVGKTTVWEAALAVASGTGCRTLVTRAVESELPLSFVGLGDLLADVDLAAFSEIPAPQRHALEVVLYRAEPTAQTTLDTSAAAMGLANLLRGLATGGPVLIAIDDVASLDRPSLETLTFAARRLGDCAVRFLLTRRAGMASELEDALAPLPVEQLELGALTLGATRLLLAERLGLVLSRRMLRRLHEEAGGNPLLVLELGMAAHGRQVDDPLATTPIARAEELFGDRVAALPPAVRQLLLAVALSPDITEAELATLGARALAEALRLGVVVADGRRVRAAHPLLAEAARGRSSREERRQLHLRVAGVVAGAARKLHHAALGTVGPDVALAAALEEAAGAALAHGALPDALELRQHALRLTLAAEPAMPERLLALAELLVAAGELPAVIELLAPRVEALPTGRQRARAHLLIGEASPLAEHEVQLELALEHAAGEPDLVAATLAAKAILLALIRVEQIENAEAFAEQAVLAAKRSMVPEAEARGLHSLAWARILRGHAIEDLGLAGDEVVASLYESALERPTAVRLSWRGQIAESRALLDRLLARAEVRGEARSCVVLYLHRCELELRAGDTHAAAASLDAWEAWTADEAPSDVETIRARCRALLAAMKGQPDEATHWADAADASNVASGFAWDRLEVLRARGLAALQQGDPARAAASLRPIWEHALQQGINDPGAFPVAGDLVEALLALGQLEDATVILDRLSVLIAEQRHPWGGVTVSRCQGLLKLAEHPDDDAFASLEAAANDYLELGLRFEAARTLLTAGRAARRQRRWGLTSVLIERATAIFDELGADGWVMIARAASGRRRSSQPGELTDAETRVAHLALDGLSNKEIATQLVLSVSTVETHLKRIYAKLGINSRTQLSRRIGPARGSRPG